METQKNKEEEKEEIPNIWVEWMYSQQHIQKKFEVDFPYTCTKKYPANTKLEGLDRLYFDTNT